MVLLEIIYPLIMGIVGLFMGALFLMLTTKMFKTQNNNYGTALKVVLWPIIISTILSIVLNYVTNQTLLVVLWIITFIGLLVLNLWLVKTNYLVGIGKAFLILLVAFLIGIIPAIIVALIIGMIMAVIGLGMQFGKLF